MPEIEKAVERVVRLEAGDHWWNARSWPSEHTCKKPCALPADKDEAHAMLEELRTKWRLGLEYMLATMDWTRIMLLAQGRHSALHEEHDEEWGPLGGPTGVCGECIMSAIVFDVQYSHGLPKDEWEARTLPDQFDLAQKLKALIELPVITTTGGTA